MLNTETDKRYLHILISCLNYVRQEEGDFCYARLWTLSFVQIGTKVCSLWRCGKVRSRVFNTGFIQIIIFITAMGRITTFRSTTDRGKNFLKLCVSWLWRKITWESKSSMWMKPPYSGNVCLKGLPSIWKPSRCQVSRFV